MATGEVNAVSIPVNVSSKSYPPGLMTGWISELLRREGSAKLSALTLVHNGTLKIPEAKLREDHALATANFQIMYPLSTKDEAPGFKIKIATKNSKGDQVFVDKKITSNSLQNFIAYIYVRCAFIRHMCLYAHNSHGQGYGYYLKKRAREELKLLDQQTEIRAIVPPVGFRDEFTELGAVRSCDKSWYIKAMAEYTEQCAEAISTYAKKIKSIDPWFIGQSFVRPGDIFGSEDEEKMNRVAKTPSLYFKTDSKHVFRMKQKSAKLSAVADTLRSMKVTFAALDLWAFREGVYPAKCWVGEEVYAQGMTDVPKRKREWGRALQLARRAKFVNNPSDRLSEDESWELDGLLNPESFNDQFYTEKVVAAAWKSFDKMAKDHNLILDPSPKDISKQDRRRCFLDDVAFVEVLLHELAGMKDPSRNVEIVKPLIYQKVAEHYGLNYSQADRHPWDLRNPHNKNRFDSFVESLVALRDEDGSQFSEAVAQRVSVNAISLTKRLEGVWEPTIPGLGTTEQYYPCPDNTYRDGDQCFLPYPSPVYAGRVADDRAAFKIANQLDEPVKLDKTYSALRVGVIRGELDPDSELAKKDVPPDAERVIILAPQVDAYMTETQKGNRIIMSWVYPVDKQTFPRNPKLEHEHDPSRYLDEDFWEDADYMFDDYCRRHRWLSNFLINGEITGKYNKIIDGIREAPDIVMIKHTNAYLEEYVKLFGEATDVEGAFGYEVPSLGIRNALILEMNDRILSPGEEKKGLEREQIDDGASGIEEHVPSEAKGTDASKIEVTQNELEKQFIKAAMDYYEAKKGKTQSSPASQTVKTKRSEATKTGKLRAGSKTEEGKDSGTTKKRSRTKR